MRAKVPLRQASTRQASTFGHKTPQNRLSPFSIAQSHPVTSTVSSKPDEHVQAKRTGLHHHLSTIPISRPDLPLEQQQRIPAPLRTPLEHTFQEDFSQVVIHTNSLQAAHLGALAYAQGHDIYIAPGMFHPIRQHSQMLLRHELAHVLQQRQGRVRPTGLMQGIPVNNDANLEREADAWSQKPLSYSAGSDRATIGNTHSRENTASRLASTSSVVQGKFGFELELGVLLSKKYDVNKDDTDPDAYADPGLGKKDYILGGSPDSIISLVEDHASGGPRSTKGVRFEEHLQLTQKEREAGYRSRIGVVPPEKQQELKENPSLFKEESQEQEGVPTPQKESKEEVPFVGPEEIKQPSVPNPSQEKPQAREREIRKESSYTSILEIVTAAVDETLPKKDAIAPMQAARELAENIGEATGQLTKRVPLTKVIPDSKVKDLYLGSDDKNKNGQTLAANIQASYGLQLPAVPAAIEEHAQNTSPEDQTIINGASAKTNRLITILQKLPEKQPLSLQKFKNDQSTLEKIKGLLHLFSLYLSSGTVDRSAYLDKNVIPLLIRHPLSQSVKKLSEEAKAYLRQGKFIDSLLNINERQPDEYLFKHRELKSYPGPISEGGDQPTCRAWLTSVLEEKPQGDIFYWFEETREIGPESDNPTVSPDVVLEARTLKPANQLSDPPEGEIGRFPPERWTLLAEKYWNMLREGNRVGAQ